MNNEDKKTQYQFVAVSTMSELLLAEIHKSELASWVKTGKTPIMKNPRVIQPVRAHNGQTMLSFVPIFPIRSVRSDTYVTPTSLQVIGDVVEVKGSNECREDPSLYGAYQNAIAQSEAVKAGITAPSTEEIANVNKKSSIIL